MTKKTKIDIKSFFSSPFLLILVLGFLLRLALYTKGTYHLDVNTFVAWSKTLANEGIPSFYQNVWSDYLPGYLYVLYILGKIRDLVSVDYLFLYKLPAIIADLAAGYLVYKIVNKLKGKRLALITSAFYIFNPAIFTNSTLWGQVDSITILFSLLSIYLLDKNWLASSLSLAAGASVKPQAALAALVVAFVMLRERWSLYSIVKYVGVAFLATLLLFFPFSGKNIFVFIYERLKVTFDQYPYTSVNAFSVWGLQGFWKPDTAGTVSSQTIGYISFLSVSLIASIMLWTKKNSRYLLLAILFAANFMFFTRMHERHLLPALAPLLISSAINVILWIPYLGLSLTYIANLYYAYGSITGIFSAFSQGEIVSLILLNMVFLTVIIYSLFSKDKEFSLKGLYRGLKKRVDESGKIITFLKNNSKVLLIAILSFGLIARIVFLWNPPQEYFDEVYHAFTAKVAFHGGAEPWEWWNDPPEGFAYEWTHPPIAKLGMVLGMGILGENAFGWRIPGAILGTISILLIYLISLEIFKDRVLSLLSAGAFSLSGLALVMSRIGMNDIYLLTFSLLSFYLFLKDKSFLSALSFGLAVSSKWSAVWLIPIIVISHLALKKKIRLSYLWFLVVPPVIYLASYLPMFLTGHNFDIFIGMQKQMWWYHTQLEADHAYTSLWWSWPFLARPIWLYTSGRDGGLVANIYAMGNPIIFWGGLISLAVSGVYSFFEKNKKLGLIIFSYLIFFAPWAMSPRIMFLYHYLPSIPFLAIAIGWVLRRYEKLIIPFFSAALLLFIYFYPHLAGIKVPIALDTSYYWFNSWR